MATSDQAPVLTWPQATLRTIQGIVADRGDGHFTRQELLPHLEAIVKAVRSKGKTPGQTLCRVLQTLRDRGQILFLTRGSYRYVPAEATKSGKKRKPSPKKMTRKRSAPAR